MNIKMPNSQIVTIVDSREPVNFSILTGSLKKAGLSVDDFLKLLKGESLD